MVSSEFETAKAALEASDAKPGTEDKLALYSLFKQATLGDAQGKRPGMTDFVGRAKYDAWAKRSGMSPADAEAAYIAHIGRLIGG